MAFEYFYLVCIESLRFFASDGELTDKGSTGAVLIYIIDATFPGTRWLCRFSKDIKMEVNYFDTLHPLVYIASKG